MVDTISVLSRLGKLRKIWTSPKSPLYEWQLWRRSIQGLPEGIAFETLNKLCLEHKGEPLRDVSHSHLSGWKVSGAYRLFLRTASGRTWRLIYKNAIYEFGELPALRGLPIRPGPPEYLVYKHSDGPLSQYLPRVFLCSEVVPGRWYQYVLEDLSRNYRVLGGLQAKRMGQESNLLKAVSELPRLHHVLREWYVRVDPTLLLRFDHEFSVALLRYAKRGLESYIRQTGDRTASRIVRLWPSITELLGRREFLGNRSLRPIHGDYHHRHLYVHKRDPGGFKLIDWEWTGLGRPHDDLASLLKRLSPDAEEIALARFSQQDKSLSLHEHKRLYEWSQLERGLLDAAYLARQQMESPRKPEWMTRTIHRSIKRALRARQQMI